MRSRAVVSLGVGQCVNWGVLYYAFAVLLLPVEAALAVPRWVVTGAFSLALLVSAMLAPSAGRWADRGQAPAMMLAGGLASAAILLAWAAMPSVFTLYLAWAGLGACMALTLYEPAFAIVGRRHPQPVARLRALALVTLFGGLASTIFLPLTSALVRAAGWSGAVVVLALLLAASTWWTHAAVRERPAGTETTTVRVPHGGAATRTTGARLPRLVFLPVVFGLASLASTAVIANLVPAVVERHLTPAAAGWLGGTLGLMQLPGRALMLRDTFAISPFRLLAISLGLQGLGLLTWAAVPGPASVVAGLMIFAAGAGLTTLARPYLVQTAFADHPAGSINGRIARVQHLSRAAGPVAAAAAAHYATYGVILLVLGAGFAAMAAAAWCRAGASAGVTASR